MFTDMHNHFVYGVDDGCADQEAMLKLLTALHADGVTRIISTSHITPGQRHFPAEDYQAHFEEAKQLIAENSLNIDIYTGHEILYTDAASLYLREGKAYTLAGSDFALVEFMPTEKYELLCEAAQKIRNAGYIPVFAHIERYACLSDIKRVIDLKDRFGVRLQVNCSLFVRKQGFLRKLWIRNLMKNDLIDYVSTDTHDMPGREPCFTQCYETLLKEYGAETAMALTHDNAEELFE